ncbi:MAG: prolyl oligopeptidase family serine peptidase [Phycisphaerales bacterium]|nr:prolyl oligopeptidase family serine peptidase [Phycisphaerales bacterium]
MSTIVRVHLLLSLIALLAPTARAQAEESPIPPGESITPERICALRSVREAVISPDGDAVAYALRIPRDLTREDDGDPWVELHVVDVSDMPSSRGFVTGNVEITGIAWRPDGGAISFRAKRDGDKHKRLYVIPLNGGEAEPLVTHGADIGGYAWAPDGRRIAFIAIEPKPDRAEKLEKKGLDQHVIEEQDRPKRVWIVDTGDPAAKPRMLPMDGSAVALAWRPDGARLAVQVAPSSRIDDTMMCSTLITVDAETGAVARVIDWKAKMGGFAWSPGGSHIALIAGEDLFDPSAGRLLVVHADETAPLNVLPGFEGQVETLAWQDDETCMFITHEGVFSTFGKVGARGAGLKTIVPTGGPILTSLSLSRDGQSAAFIADAPAHPSEVYFMRHGDEGPGRLTDSNPWLSGARLAPQEPIRYAARDGVEIDAILMRPLDQQPDTRYPLIILAHGGPESHLSNGWLTHYSYPGQMAAGRGYAVLYPNYRGSTGRGVTFSKLGQHDYGGAEFDDIVDGITFLDQMGLVDPARVGITGASYGGYASAWAATKLSDRYAAAVMQVGISDQVAKFGATDIPQEMYHAHSNAWPWEDWTFFEERSPIRYVENAHTPILICHGEKDTRVHPSQAMSLYRYLKTYGKTPVRLVMYPHEGHGNQRAGARYDYCLRMLRWFDHYLKGPGGAPPPVEVVYSPEFVGDVAVKPETEDEQQPADEPEQTGARWYRHDTTILDSPVLKPADGGDILESDPMKAALPFSEAVVSWNIDTPQKTGFAVEMRVRAESDAWSPWLFLGDGAGTDGETPAFERVTTFDGGAIDVDYFRSARQYDTLQLRVHLRCNAETKPTVNRLAFCVSDRVDGERATSGAPRPAPEKWQRRLDVPFRGQVTPRAELAGRICSPASVAMTLAYYGVDIPTETVADACFDRAHDIYGAWPRAIQAAYGFGAPGYLTRISDWADVEDAIVDNRPLIISIRVPRAGDLRGAPYETTAGHLIVITGFTADGGVCVNDSAADDATTGQVVYRREDLENVWMRGSGGLTYVLFPPSPPLREQ